MFSHVFVGVSDFDRAYAFYEKIMQCLAITPRFYEKEKSWAGWQSEGGRPLFVIAKPFDGLNHHAGNGQMVAFLASSHDVVRSTHALALALGGHCEGQPGLRPQYHEHYHGAYFRDPDGNKICVVCHDSVAHNHSATHKATDLATQ